MGSQGQIVGDRKRKEEGIEAGIEWESEGEIVGERQG